MSIEEFYNRLKGFTTDDVPFLVDNGYIAQFSTIGSIFNMYRVIKPHMYNDDFFPVHGWYAAEITVTVVCRYDHTGRTLK